MYYSWLGATTSSYRNMGIATTLMDMQHKWCREKRYTSIRTKTIDSNVQMKSLNQSFNFLEISFEHSDIYDIKILSEKSLI
jgi:predicted GNAT superfamily acetyltransferase